MKVCSTCGIEKSKSSFRKEPRTIIGYQASCLSCERVYKSEYRKRPKSIAIRLGSDRRRKLSYKDLYTNNPSLIDIEKICTSCSKSKSAFHFNVSLSSRGGLRDYCKACERDKKRTQYQETKQLVYDKLGNFCKDCGFSDKRALQIDHVNGGGNREHQEVKNSLSFLKKVLADTTNAYQILCANCNWIKRHERVEEPLYEYRLAKEIASLESGK